MKVFYSDKMWAENAGAFSPSAKKPKLVVEEWLRLGFPIEVVAPVMATVKDLSLAHSKKYIVGVMTGKEVNGFGNTDDQVRASLPFTTGSMISAAKAALTDGIACSVTSGFHHATYSSGGGFCTFNGLIVAAQKLKRENNVDRVGILDMDNHYGNGTDNIIRMLNLDYIDHYTIGGDHSQRTADMTDYLGRLPELIRTTFKDCSIVLYQAGADLWKDDPLGGLMTKDELRLRDQIVFETCRELGIGVAWNLAGGYSDPFQHVLDIHNATMEEGLRSFFSMKATRVARWVWQLSEVFARWS